jgi:hypothetical protein
MPNEPAVDQPLHPLAQMTTYELSGYRRQLESATARGEGMPCMQSDPDQHGEAPGVPAIGSAEQIRRHLAASRGLCLPGSAMGAIIDAHLAVMDSAATADAEPVRPLARMETRPCQS